MIDWFLKQPDVVQSAIIGVDFDAGPAYADLLMKLAEQLRKATPRGASGMRLAAGDLPELNPENVPGGKYRKK